MSEAIEKATRAHEASAAMRRASNAARVDAIRQAAARVAEARDLIIDANRRDMTRAREAGMSAPLQDRLLLTDERIQGIVGAMRAVADQADPIGRVLTGRTLDSGVRMEQVTVPLGVVAMIYEARPNVTADAFALCARTGNAVVLRGGSAAHDSCRAIADACRAGLVAAGLPGDALQLIDAQGEEGHRETERLMRANGLIDVLIPRGGAALIQSCVRNATVPVIQTGTGNCHVYLHESADPSMAVRIVVNAKTQRPGTCNSAESLLVDDVAAERLLPPVCAALVEHGVALVGDERARAVAAAHGVEMGAAVEEDWGREYLDLKMSVRCVSGVDEAIAHVNRYGTGHSEAIITSDYAAGERFLAGVDAAAVYVNASTRFTDGGMFGLGCEIGISTQKMHVRGPMGASALTTTKYLLRGDGQTR
ncbi:glutamate-5-semialdehyde dehydrogenase [bacterium]|nr:glutamate-5-semialdehyde dehydrogenase [bacterium]